MSRVQPKVNRRAERRNAKNERRLKLVTPETALQPTATHKPDTSKIVGRNPNQERYITAIKHKPIIVGTGLAGTGKTFVATALAADMLKAKDFERIVVTRPVLQADEDLGFLPGDISEKFAPYFRPVYEVLRERLGSGYLGYCLKPEVETVLVAPFAYLRGMTFKDSIVLLDEAQNTTVNQMKLFLTRIGEGSKVIINGDVNQCDLPKGVKSGLVDLLERLNINDVDIPVIEFTKEDSVRSPVCSLALKIYE